MSEHREELIERDLEDCFIFRCAGPTIVRIYHDAIVLKTQVGEEEQGWVFNLDMVRDATFSSNYLSSEESTS